MRLFFRDLFARLYALDLKLRAKLPSWAKELVGGFLLAVAAGSWARATAISAGYEALVDHDNATAKDGFIDFAQRQLVIIAWYAVVR